MNNAINDPQTVLVLGGTSDIGQAIVAKLATTSLRQVILAVRQPDQVDVEQVAVGDADVAVVGFDATDAASHEALIADVAEEYGDLDVIVQAFGQLGASDLQDPIASAELATVNYAGAVSSGLAAAKQLRLQGHGTLVVLSSVAGVRTRGSNFVYGSTKAGQDAFATGLGHALHGTGAKVMTVRPGFVRSAMTDGLEEAPFSVDPDDVADAVVTGLRSGKSVVWVPGKLRYVFGLLRFAPDAVWRKLDK